MKYFLIGFLLSIAVAAGCASLSRAAEPAPAQTPGQTLTVYAATSVAPAVQALSQAFGEHIGVGVKVLADEPAALRGRWQKGETADLFVSSDTQNAAVLSRMGLASESAVWGRKRLVAVAAPGIKLDAAALPGALAQPGLTLGAGAPDSPTGTDEAGGLTWLFLERLDAAEPGLSSVLRQRIRPLADLEAAKDLPRQDGRTGAALVLEKGLAQVLFLTEPEAQSVIRQLPGATMLPLPELLTPSADMAMVTAKEPSDAARRLAGFLASPRSGNLLHRFGIQPAAR